MIAPLGLSGEGEGTDDGEVGGDSDEGGVNK